MKGVPRELEKPKRPTRSRSDKPPRANFRQKGTKWTKPRLALFAEI